MKKVFVIGGGVIGLFSAYYLIRKGYEVTVVDQGDFTDGCSFGNAGLIAPSHIIPLASPGMVSTAMRWLFNPKAPVALRFPPPPDLVLWAARFLKAAAPGKVKQAIPALKALSVFSQTLYHELAGEGLPVVPEKKGLLMLCRSGKTFKEELEAAGTAQNHGLESETWLPEKIRQAEPGVAPEVTGGVYYPGDNHLDPAALMQTLMHYLRKSGVNMIGSTLIRSVAYKGGAAVSVEMNGRKEPFDELVAACGSWTPALLRTLGVKLFVQPGRGYSFTVQSKAPIRYPALLMDDRISVTPLPSGFIRFGGGMELGYRQGKVARRRFQQLCGAVSRYYPSLDNLRVDEHGIWQGCRPCSFDGLPYIGTVPGYKNVYVATGHSMLGVTLAPATGKLISELIGGEPPSVDVGPFRVDR